MVSADKSHRPVLTSPTTRSPAHGFGDDEANGSPARTAIGVATEPLNLPVVISAEAVIVAPKH